MTTFLTDSEVFVGRDEEPYEDCPDCYGSGIIDGDICDACEGYGVVPIVGIADPLAVTDDASTNDA